MSDPGPHEDLRLFVAIEIPDPVREAIAGAQQAFRTAIVRSRCSWTPPEQFHLTLKFLGSVPKQPIDALVSALRGVAIKASPLELTCSAIGFFPSAREPRVAWAGIQDAASSLQKLQAGVEVATAPFTSEAPENRFHAHATFARIKNFWHGEATALERFKQEFLAAVFGRWTAREFVLMRSQLSPRGAIYTAQARLPLGSPASS